MQEGASGMVSARNASKIIRELLDRGFRFTIIGGTVVELALGRKDLGDDIDFFAEEPSVLIEEDSYYSLAEELGWIAGQTWLGTPRIVARASGEDVPLEFYDNLHDFYVPPEILDRAERVNLDGVRVRMVTVEDHIVLKANAGRGTDMDRLKELARLASRGKLKVDNRKMREAAELFDEPNVILRRLRDAGFKI